MKKKNKNERKKTEGIKKGKTGESRENGEIPKREKKTYEEYGGLWNWGAKDWNV